MSIIKRKIEEICGMYEEGYTIFEIAWQLRISVDFVKNTIDMYYEEMTSNT